jgi:GntR family transcriptional regulator
VVPEAGRGAPLHERIRHDLEDAILGGRFAAGERLPSERQLCAQYGVSRITAIRALNDLAQTGLARRVHGRGTIVAHTRVRRGFDTAMGLTEAARRIGLTTRAVVLERREVAGTEVPAGLAADPAARYLRVVRLRFLGTTPAVFSTTFIPLPIALALTARDLEEGSLFEAFARITGMPVGRSRQAMMPITAGVALARRLGVPRGSAHLQFTGTTLLADGRVAELTRSVFRGDLFEFVADMRRDPACLEAGKPPRGRQGQPIEKETVP